MTEQEFNNRVAENLVKYRQLCGFTQSELAECINYSNKSISKWERGEAVPGAYILLALSEIYEISVSELIGQHKPGKDTERKMKEFEKDKKAREKAKKRALEKARKKNKEKKK